MNKNFESIIQSPIMKMASENQARLDSMAAATESTISLSKLADNLDPSHRWKGYLVTEGLLSKLSETFPQNSLVINDSIAERLKILTELTHLNTPLSESVNLSKTLLQAFEETHLGLKPPTQFIFPEGIFSQKQFGDISIIMSKATEAFRQLESLSSLDSLKALSRIENFPNDAELDKVSDMALEEPQTILAEVKRLDAKINKELCTVDDFNDLSEETKRDSNLFLKYYYWLVMNLVVSLCLLEDSLGKDLDLSRKSFTIADNVGEVIIDIGHYWNGNKVALFNSFIVTQVNKLIGLIVN